MGNSNSVSLTTPPVSIADTLIIDNVIPNRFDHCINKISSHHQSRIDITSSIDMREAPSSLSLQDDFIGSGMFGNVHKLNNSNEKVIKTSLPGAQNNFIKEAAFFRRYYGENSAEVITLSNKKIAIIMNKIPGKPLTKVPDFNEVVSQKSINQMLSKLMALGIQHNDLTCANILWDENTQTLNPIDFGKAYDRPSFGHLEETTFG